MRTRRLLSRPGWSACLGAAALLAGSSAADTRHTVRPGDTVPRLSWQYKIRAERIRAANGLRGDALAPGRVLVIPEGEAKEEGVKKKEEAMEPSRSVRPAPREVRTAVSVEPRSTPATPAPLRRAVPVPAREVEPADEPPVESPRGTPARSIAPGPLPPPRPGPLPGPRDEPPLEAARSPRSAKLGPGLSRELPRVPEERAEPARPGRLPAQPPEERADEPPAQPEPARARAPGRDPNDTPGQALIKAAQRLSREGIRYNGSWTPPGERNAWVMDCSNTARWIYKSALGIDLPRTASDQYLAFQRAGKLRKAPRGWFSKDVNRKKLDHDLRTGDLLFWENTYRPVRNPDITHVMVFLGTDPQGRWMMAGSEGAKGVNIYTFDPDKKKGGYSTFLGLFKHHGKFVAYARGI